ncbi:MAG: hypothetical protein AB1420_02190 [Bacillota bacterium]
MKQVFWAVCAEHTTSPMENATVKMVDLHREIKADIERLHDLKKEILWTINQLNDVSQQLILEMRYIN